MARGRMKYVPPVIIEELESIKAEHMISMDVEALRKLAQYSRVGREVEKIKRQKPRGLF